LATQKVSDRGQVSLCHCGKEEGLLLKPVKSFWDMAGSCSDEATVEEVKAELDKLRHQDEDNLQP
jgi:hypothetical protein